MITVKDLLAQKTQRAIYHVVVSDTVQKVLEMMREQDLRCARHGADRHRVIACPAHAASSGTSAA